MCSSSTAETTAGEQGSRGARETDSPLPPRIPAPLHSKTLVLGLGNPLLGDDGVGWRVVEQVQARITRPEIEFDFHSGGGLSLMERLIGYTRAIIVDALNTGRQPQGTVSSFRLEDLPNDAQSHLASAHETTLQTALQVGRTMGAALPNDIRIVAIEAQNVYDFSEELSPAVASAVPKAVELVIGQLGDQSTSDQ